ncbi:MAG: ABC transporter substrate-binding protein, partial [Chloroflexota bacterium]|nr:ABC transporter substrate-binding protein [Chloroflexota bacterium]
MRADFSAPPLFGDSPKTGGQGIAHSWELASDLSKITFKLNPKAEFHRGWGKVRAADVVWSMQEAAKEGTKSTRGPILTIWIAKWEAVDDLTVVAHVKPGKLDPTWRMLLSDSGGGSVPIVSKRLYDEKGEDGARRTEAGTGVLVSTKWTTQEEVRGEPVPNHWRVTPKVKEVRVVAIPETAARIAAIRAGEVHISAVPVKMMDEVVKSAPGVRTIQLGQPQRQVFYFAGNYWAKLDQEGKPLDPYPRPGFKPDKDHPWIGDPGKCEWTELVITTPCLEANESMQKARKVRYALNLAIDRKAIKEKVFTGYSQVIWTSMVPEEDPNFKKEWIIPYDPAKAKQLLAEAGVPEGFAFTTYVAPDNPGGFDPEGGEVVAQMWRALGLKVAVEKTVYAARRPTYVARSIDIPKLHHTNWLMFDEPKGGSLITTPGYNDGVEVPDVWGQLRWANVTEPSEPVRRQNNVKFQDFLSYWMLTAAYVTLEPYWIVRPEVKEWAPHQQSWTHFISPETIVMK